MNLMSTGRCRPGLLLGRRPAVLEREFDQRAHVAHAQLHHQAAAIGLDRLRGQANHACDLAARLALDHELQHLPLANATTSPCAITGNANAARNPSASAAAAGEAASFASAAGLARAAFFFLLVCFFHEAPFWWSASPPALALVLGSSGLLAWSFCRAADFGAATRYLERCGQKSDG